MIYQSQLVLNHRAYGDERFCARNYRALLPNPNAAP
jgi:hypothetical protein